MTAMPSDEHLAAIHVLQPGPAPSGFRSWFRRGRRIADGFQVRATAEASWPLNLVGLAWIPEVARDHGAAAIGSLAFVSVATWMNCRSRVRASGDGVEVRSPWKTRTFRWSEVQGFVPDKAGSQLTVLTTTGDSHKIPATFTRSLSKRTRTRVLGEWAAQLEALRPGGGRRG